MTHRVFLMSESDVSVTLHTEVRINSFYLQLNNIRFELLIVFRDLMIVHRQF